MITGAKQLAISIAVAVLVMVGFNAGVSRLARNSTPRQLLRELDQSHHPDMLALGHSQIAADFDARAFDQSCCDSTSKSFNAGLGATSSVEHLLILRRALQRSPHPRFVIYGFFDFGLTEAEPCTVSDLFGNRAMSFYLEPAFAMRYYSMPLLDRVAFAIYRWIPMLVDRSTIWGDVELLRRRMQEVGLPAATTNRFGRVQDFDLLEPASEQAFATRGEQLISESAPLSAPVLEMIREAKRQGACFVFVEMPMHPEHQRRFYSLPQWRRYREYVRGLLKREGATYVQASDWIKDPAEFADHLHLNETGAVDFSRRLGLFLRSHDKQCTSAGCAPDAAGRRVAATGTND